MPKQSFGTSKGRSLGRSDAANFSGFGAARIKIESPDLKKAREQLLRFPKTAEPIHDKAVQKAARALAEVTRGSSRTPVDTGRMRASIHHRRLTRLAAAAFVGARYGGYVHEGTSRMKGRPFFEWALKGGAQKKINEIFEKALGDVNYKLFGRRGK